MVPFNSINHAIAIGVKQAKYRNLDVSQKNGAKQPSTSPDAKLANSGETLIISSLPIQR